MENIYDYSELSGHTHYGSPHETASSCGNCDGAKCDNCQRVYIVKHLDTGKIIYMGSDLEEARSYGYGGKEQC